MVPDVTTSESLLLVVVITSSLWEKEYPAAECKSSNSRFEKEIPTRHTITNLKKYN